jgi:hypothetical protein
MLRSLPCRKSEPGKHWFSDAEHDLFYWLDPKGQVIAFQFSYNKSTTEYMISWNISSVFSHSRIDDGENVNQKIKMTPILIPTEAPDCSDLARRFQQISQALETAISNFIFTTLQNHTQ